MGGFFLNIIFLYLWLFICRILIPKKRTRDRVFVIISFCQLWLMNVLRAYSVGQDTQPYMQAFDQIAVGGIGTFTNFEWEPGYVFLNWIVAKLGLGFRGLLVVIATFSYYSIFRFICRYSPEKWLSVILFVVFGYYYATYHILRQTVALSIILFSYDTIITRNKRRFIFLIICATCFHFTAILFGFTYFIWSGKRITLPKFISVFSICLFISSFVINILLNTAFGFIARYETYTHTDLGGEGYGMLCLLLFLSFMGLLLPKNNLSKRDILIYLLMTVATCLQSFTTSFSLFARICWYWNFGLIAYIPLCIELTRNKRIIHVLNVVIIALALAFFVTTTNVNENKEEYATYKLME